MPVSFDGKTLVVAMADAMNKGALDDIRFTANCEVKGVVAEPGQVAAAIEKAYGKEQNVMASILKEIELCRRWGLRHLYLGLYVAGCRPMEYKASYLPHERLVGGKWQRFERRDPA